MEKEGFLSKKTAYFLFGIIGFVFVFFTKTGADLAEEGNLLWSAGYVCGTLLLSLVLGGAMGGMIVFLLYGFAEGRWHRKRSDSGNDSGTVGAGGLRGKLESLRPRTVFWGSLALILLAWLPAYLAYYPGICAYDFPVQTEQIIGNSFIDHHPIAHTLLLNLAFVLGENVLGNINGGIGILTALQMVFLGMAMAYGLLALRRFRVGIVWQVLLLAYCMVYPFHWYMSASMTKDTVFSGFVLLFVTSVSQILLEDRDQFRMGGTDALLALSCVGIVLFRNNGKYAFLVLLVFLGLALWRGRKRRRLWGRLLLGCGTAFLVGNLLLALLYSATNAQQGDKREMLSMPIQQLARTMLYHGGVGELESDDGTMSETDRALINDFLLNESYRFYQPGISDPVKRHTNTYVVRYRTAEFLQTYFHLLRLYPGDFINAALAVDAGYIYPGDTSHAHVNEEEGFRNKGYAQTRWDEQSLNPVGIYKDSKWEGLHGLLEKWAEDNAYLNWPVLRYLFMPGVYLYLYLLLFGWLMIRRSYGMCLPLSFVLGYYLTLFLGPTVQLRYLYPVMLALPFLAVFTAGAGNLKLEEVGKRNGSID